ncbi:class I SAM-dependent methyltransferase [Phenylobacterium terrae]|uniref:Class I SAM-dependent methyltransferase n=1 Tax=Phenylobacterium terrae TaxID=2665495 RepID=A0ABW4N797_9CAUL
MPEDARLLARARRAARDVLTRPEKLRVLGPDPELWAAELRAHIERSSPERAAEAKLRNVLDSAIREALARALPEITALALTEGVLRVEAVAAEERIIAAAHAAVAERLADPLPLPGAQPDVFPRGSYLLDKSVDEVAQHLASLEEGPALAASGLLRAHAAQALADARATRKRLVDRYLPEIYATEQAEQQLLWVLENKQPYFGDVQERITAGSVRGDYALPEPQWTDPQHQALADYMRMASPDRHRVSTAEGTLQINVPHIAAAGARMKAAMIGAGVAPEFAERESQKRMREALVGARLEPQSFREFFNALGTLYSTPIYDLYLERFGFEALAERRFYNLGCGSFSHPAWTGVDYPSEHYSKSQYHIAWDAESGEPIDAPSGRAGAVFSSHTIEHLQDKGALNYFSEAYRLLAPGGVLRITCPEFEYYYEGFVSCDAARYSFPIRPGFSSLAEAVSASFLVETASQMSPLFEPAWRGTAAMAAVNAEGAQLPTPVERTELESLVRAEGRDRAMLEVTRRVSLDVHRHMLGGHVNFWPYQRIVEFGRKAGFRHIYRSAYGQSRCPILRDTRYFDSTASNISIYVEMVK